MRSANDVGESVQVEADLVFDGNALYARAWYATCREHVDVSAAVRSALQTTFSLLDVDGSRLGRKISRTLFCWDGLHGRDKGEKRQEKPKAFHEGMDIFRQISTFLLGSAHAMPPEHEADDAVATAVESSAAADVYVVSGDKDLMQLHRNTVHYFCLNTKALLSGAFINSKFNVKHPRQVAIAQAVLGDKVDNIAGIKGWGPAKVKTLFSGVTSDMSFSAVLDHVESQIPDRHLSAFRAALERTLLNPRVPGLPQPAPLVLATSAEAADCGIGEICEAFARVHRGYSRCNRVYDADGDSEDLG